MFKEIHYGSVKQNIYKLIFPFRVIPYPGLCPKETAEIQAIKYLIGTNLNIQSTLSYLLQCAEKFPTELSTSILIPDDFTLENGIYSLQLIFNKVVISMDNENIPLDINVIGVNDEAAEIFNNMLASKEINSVITYFYMKRINADDFKEQKFYEYIKEDALLIDKYFMDTDTLEYVNHIKKSQNMSTCSSFINVSGFTFDDLNHHPCIQMLSEVFDHVYLFVIKEETPLGIMHFKQLRWYSRL